MLKRTREPKTCLNQTCYLLHKTTLKLLNYHKNNTCIPTKSKNFPNNIEKSKERSVNVPIGSLGLFQNHPVQVTDFKLSVSTKNIGA